MDAESVQTQALPTGQRPVGPIPDERGEHQCQGIEQDGAKEQPQDLPWRELAPVNPHGNGRVDNAYTHADRRHDAQQRGKCEDASDVLGSHGQIDGCGYGGSVANFALTQNHPFLACQPLQTYRATGMELVGGDADLGTEAEFKAIGKSRGGVDHDRG